MMELFNHDFKKFMHKIRQKIYTECTPESCQK